jgi:antitoxin MazE
VHVLTKSCYCTYMSKRLTRSGNSLALVIDRPLLEALGIDSDTELELSTDGDVLVVTPLRSRKRKQQTADLVAEAHEQYGGVFRRLAE